MAEECVYSTIVGGSVVPYLEAEGDCMDLHHNTIPEEEDDERVGYVRGLLRQAAERGYKHGWVYHRCRAAGLLDVLAEIEAEEARAAPALPADPDAIPRTRLTVELVPRTCWFSNVRSAVSPEDWERLKRLTFDRSGACCEICGGRGSRWPVECHEIWFYDDAAQRQVLQGLAALCPDCHEVKHLGLAGTRGRAVQARAHLARVNGWSHADAELYIEVQFEIWSQRSQHEWNLDLSWLDQFGIHATPERQEEQH